MTLTVDVLLFIIIIIIVINYFSSNATHFVNLPSVCTLQLLIGGSVNFAPGLILSPTVEFVNKSAWRLIKNVWDDLTTTLTHERKVSGNGGVDLQGQGHDWEGDCSSALRGGPSNHGSEDHRDRHQVPVLEQPEVVVLDGQSPPDWKGLK